LSVSDASVGSEKASDDLHNQESYQYLTVIALTAAIFKRKTRILDIRPKQVIKEFEFSNQREGFTLRRTVILI